MITLRPLCLGLCAALLLLGCSDSGGNPDGSVPKEGGQTDGPGLKKDGDPCAAASECQGGLCIEKKCTRTCSGPGDCSAGQDCATDDGKRLFCRMPSYAKEIGTSCAITGSCPDSGKCVGVKEWAEAYCTKECKADLDCPPAFFCREFSDKKKYCTRRGFCNRCLYDEMCGSDKKCIKQGTESFCTRTCSKGSTECPRFADCKDGGGGRFVCMHKSGSCVGDGRLCSACTTKDDCAPQALCLTYTYSKESFCGQDCTSTGTCATGYKCGAISSTEKQCVPDDAKQPKCVASLSPTGEVGDVLQDFAMTGYIDSNNDGSLTGEKLRIIKLSDYASKAKIILFNVSAGWCPSCQSETKTFASLMQTYGAKGLMIFQTLDDSDDQTTHKLPTFQLLDAWVAALSPAGAVGLDPNGDSTTLNTGGTVPLNMILDAKTRKVLEKTNGYSQATIDSQIQKHLGISP